jgi:hypothetical protein
MNTLLRSLRRQRGTSAPLTAVRRQRVATARCHNCDWAVTTTADILHECAGEHLGDGCVGPVVVVFSIQPVVQV